MPKCMSNVMVSDTTCKECEDKGRGQVNKLRFDIHFKVLDQAKLIDMEKFLDEIDY